MNIKEYRKEIYERNDISWKESREELRVKYHHTKLYHISKVIKKVVDLSLKKNITEEEFTEKVDALLNTLPQEFIDKYKEEYKQYILEHWETKERTQNLLCLVQKLYGQNQPDVNPNNVNIWQHGIATVSALPTKYRNDKFWKKIGGALDCQTKITITWDKKEYNIHIPKRLNIRKTQKNIVHEYNHILNKKIFPQTEKVNYNVLEAKSSLNKNDINWMIKDEFLAMVAWNAINTMKEDNLIVPGLAVIYLEKYIKKLWYKNIKMHKEYEEDTDPNTWNKYYRFLAYEETDNWERKLLSPELQKLVSDKINFITQMYMTYEKLKAVCYDKYSWPYRDLDQFHYILAFSPFSQRKNILNTYEKLYQYKHGHQNKATVEQIYSTLLS